MVILHMKGHARVDRSMLTARPASTVQRRFSAAFAADRQTLEPLRSLRNDRSGSSLIVWDDLDASLKRLLRNWSGIQQDSRRIQQAMRRLPSQGAGSMALWRTFGVRRGSR